MSDTQQMAGTAKQQGGKVAGSAKEQSQQVAGTTKAEVADVVGTAAEQAKGLLGEVTSEVTSKADEQAARLGERLREMSKQLRSMAESTDEQGLATSAVRSLGEQSGRLADKLSSDGTSSVASEVSRYARNNPGSFLLGALVAGVAAGRLTRGAKDQSQQSSGGSTQSEPVLPPVASAAALPISASPAHDTPAPIAPAPVAVAPATPDPGGRL
jgi:hypothetical protein